MLQEKMEESLYLTDREFVVLAACAGLQEVESIFRKPVRTDMTSQDVRYICHGLIQREILKPGSGPAEPYLTIMRTMGNAPFVLFVTLRRPSGTVCYYPGRSVVRTEISPLEENSIRVRLIPEEVFIRDLLSSESFPSTACDALEADPDAPERLRRLFGRPAFLQEAQLDEEKLPDNVTVMVEQFFGRNRKVIRRIFLVEDSGIDYAAVVFNGSVGIFRYTEEEFSKLIRQIQRESEEP